MRSSKPGGPVVAARECDMGRQNEGMFWNVEKIHFPAFFPMKLITYSCVFLEYDLCFTGQGNQF